MLKALQLIEHNISGFSHAASQMELKETFFLVLKTKICLCSCSAVGLRDLRIGTGITTLTVHPETWAVEKLAEYHSHAANGNLM